MKTDTTKAVLALLELPRIGRKTARKILEQVSTLPKNRTELRDVLDAAQSKGVRVPDFSSEKIASAFASSDVIVKACDEKSIRIHVVHKSCQEAWLISMNSIPDAPMVLYSLGDTQILSGPCITIIGTRKPTSWGQAAASKIARQCVRKGFSVVSGLAMGCDVAAHRGAIEAGGKTVAVLAHGLDTVHPEHHKDIANQIAEESGCLLSEYAPGIPPQRGSFVERDRLQSAAGLGTIVIETGLKGGTNHTVSFARQQGRLVSCLAHPKKYSDQDTVQGNKKILEDGAFQLADSEDLSRFLDECLKSREEISVETGASSDPEQPHQDSLF